MEHNRILISGADGYIARHCIRRLRELGFPVSTASRSQGGDLFMDFSQPEQIAGTSIDGVGTMIHTVSPNEGLYQTDPCRAAAQNAAGIHAALDFCVRNQIENFIYFSSFHVFGNQVGCLTEMTPPSPCSDYGLAHCIAEQTAQMYDRQKKLSAWIIRPSNLFGVPEDLDKFKRWNLIPFAFCREAAAQRSISLLTPGHQLRNFVGINDVICKIVWILKNKPAQRLIHAYGTETISVYDYAKRVQAISSKIMEAPVQIHRPEGDGQTARFAFSSVLTDPEILPGDRLDDFIRDLTTTLIARQERNMRLK